MKSGVTQTAKKMQKEIIITRSEWQKKSLASVN